MEATGRVDVSLPTRPPAPRSASCSARDSRRSTRGSCRRSWLVDPLFADSGCRVPAWRAGCRSRRSGCPWVRAIAFFLPRGRSSASRVHREAGARGRANRHSGAAAGRRLVAVLRCVAGAGGVVAGAAASGDAAPATCQPGISRAKRSGKIRLPWWAYACSGRPTGTRTTGRSSQTPLSLACAIRGSSSCTMTRPPSWLPAVLPETPSHPPSSPPAPAPAPALAALS